MSLRMVQLFLVFALFLSSCRQKRRKRIGPDENDSDRKTRRLTGFSFQKQPCTLIS